ncbi:hypothetical protein WK03_20340 [Burkholderia cepacia]|uniref:hypothetical protein n=1 Tax=Burkholderia cepacia TaxID=292 RepID=UPI00075CA6A6|nr:hypothetical protein [Burkholderia cepacia]KVQ42519.1 hypothetical protein WK03_20340 [Burkholderia cepacia]
MGTLLGNTGDAEQLVDERPTRVAFSDQLVDLEPLKPGAREPCGYDCMLDVGPATVVPVREADEVSGGMTGRADNEFNKLRLTLRELTVKWMQTLDTQNVSTNVDIDLNLRFTFGGETLDVIGSGGSSSTTIRLVLAIHAALLEAYLSDKSRPFRFLILDTPKQEELHTADLARYLTELEKMCEANDAHLSFRPPSMIIQPGRRTSVGYRATADRTSRCTLASEAIC